MLDLAHQVRQQVEPVDVDLVLGLPVGACLVALLQLVADVGVARGGQQRRQPVVVLDDVVGNAARLDLSGPADQLRNPVGALPVGVLLAAERRGARVRPAVAVRAVVGGVDDDGVVGDAEFVEHVEHGADVAVVVDHRVVVLGLPQPGLSLALRLGVGVEVHVGEVAPHEERVARVVLPLDVVDGARRRCRRRWSPSAWRSAGRCPRWSACRPGRTSGRRVRSTPRRWPCTSSTPRGSAKFVQPRELVLVRVVELLGLLLGVEVIEVAVELVEPVHGRQVLVQVAEVVLAELAGGVAERLEQFGDRRDPRRPSRCRRRARRPCSCRCGTRFVH